MQKKILIIIPAYNEEESLPEVLNKLADLKFSYPHEVVVVNDGSTDKTRLMAENMGIVVINHTKNLGIGAALLSGISYAKKGNFDWVAEIDADGQHRPEDVEKLIRQLNDFDMVIGSRFIKKGGYQVPWLRKIVIACFKTLIWLGKRKTDK